MMRIQSKLILSMFLSNCALYLFCFFSFLVVALLVVVFDENEAVHLANHDAHGKTIVGDEPIISDGDLLFSGVLRLEGQ